VAVIAANRTGAVLLAMAAFVVQPLLVPPPGIAIVVVLSADLLAAATHFVSLFLCRKALQKRLIKLTVGSVSNLLGMHTCAGR
jgi:hypothetical protein